MLQKSTTDFLSALATNNRVEWLLNQRDFYVRSRSNILELIGALLKGISQFDSEISSDSEPDNYLMQMKRDAQFTADKRPYKTNFGIWITPLKNKGNEPAYYLHIEPGKSYLAGALWSPDSEDLARIRNYILKENLEFLSLVEDEKLTDKFNFHFSTSLKKVSKGFWPEDPEKEFLKLHTFVVQQTLSDSELLERFFIDHALQSFKLLYPLMVFFRTAIEDKSK